MPPIGTASLAEVMARHEHLLPPHCTCAVISPSPEAGAVAAHLRGLGHAVAWFVLEAGTFGTAHRPDYTALLGELASSRCDLRVIYGDRPLAASWGRHVGRGGGERRAAASR